MGYSEDESMVRVDIFKESGKWYTTISIKWEGYNNIHIYEAFRNSLRKVIGQSYKGMTMVCLEPYHEHAHPLMIKEWQND